MRKAEPRLENRIESIKRARFQRVISTIIPQTALIIAVVGITVAILLK